MKRWLLRHLFGLKWGHIDMPVGAYLNGPARIEGYNIVIKGN